MLNTDKNKMPMPRQDPTERIFNFNEVALGYDDETAVKEASRCLNCKNPACVKGCPVNVNIPEFIAYIQQGNFEEAYLKVIQDNLLPAICGRVCPQETQCEKHCVRAIKGEPVGIGYLERFVADRHMALNRKNKYKENTVGESHSIQKKVAIIGSGPAGLSCAADLAKYGYSVTVFEAFHKVGGVLVYGIPEFRLPKEFVKREIENLSELGVKFEKNCVVGKTVTIDELKQEGFEAFFIATGAGLPNFMNVPGENLNGVYSSNEFLTRVNLMMAYKFPQYDTPINLGKKVIIVGGGNVAIDSARCAKRLGAEEVHIVYRRDIEQMPARKEEIENALEEGIIIDKLTNPVRILGDDAGNVTAVECVKMQLGEPDASGRSRPEKIEHSEFIMDVDNVIIAVGQTPNPIMSKTVHGLKINDKGCIIAEYETGETSLDGVYAGGDAVTGAATVILAMGAGKKAAEAINRKFIEVSNTDKCSQMTE